MIVTLRDTKNKTTRKFVILQQYVELCKKYLSLRPPNLENSRLFCNYQGGKCTKQFIGINKISAMAKTVATYLKLNNPQQYTGHAIRRTSATMLVDAGGDIAMLKRHGGWKSSTVAEGYIDESLYAKKNIATKLSIDTPSTSSPSNDIIMDNPASSSSVIPHGSYKMNATSDKSVNVIGNNCSNCSITVNVYQK